MATRIASYAVHELGHKHVGVACSWVVNIVTLCMIYLLGSAITHTNCTLYKLYTTFPFLTKVVMYYCNNHVTQLVHNIYYSWHTKSLCKLLCILLYPLLIGIALSSSQLRFPYSHYSELCTVSRRWLQLCFYGTLFLLVSYMHQSPDHAW